MWAEALSCQVEYKYLAHLTGRREYFDAVRVIIPTEMGLSLSWFCFIQVERIMKLMYDAELQDDMFPTKWSIMTARPSNGKSHRTQL